MEQTVSQPIQSLNRGLEIIELIAKAKIPVTLNEITAKLGVNKSTAFRLANTLYSRGFIGYAEGSKAFILGPAIWSLQYQYNWNEILVTLSSSSIDNLAGKTQETTHLAVRKGRNADFLAHRIANQALVVSGRTGESVPLYCTAHGKALLAEFTLDQLKELYSDYKFKKYTKTTITDINKLAAECKLIKDRGYATDDSEIYEDIRCMAAPIKDARGNVIASIGISAPAARLTSEEHFNKKLQLVIKAAKTIEDKLYHNSSKAKM